MNRFICSGGMRWDIMMICCHYSILIIIIIRITWCHKEHNKIQVKRDGNK